MRGLIPTIAALFAAGAGPGAVEPVPEDQQQRGELYGKGARVVEAKPSDNLKHRSKSERRARRATRRQRAICR